MHVAADEAAVSLSLQRLLRSADIEPTTYVTPHALLDAAPRLQAGCILIDVRRGLELHARLRGQGNHLPTIVIGPQGDVQDAVAAMKQGAFDFLEKPYDQGVLLFSIRAALEEAARVCEELGAAARIAGLSKRERQVLDALVAGRPNKIIAFELGISVRTVEVHRARMMHRLGFRNIAGAVRLAVMAGSWKGVRAPGDRKGRVSPAERQTWIYA